MSAEEAGPRRRSRACSRRPLGPPSFPGYLTLPQAWVPSRTARPARRLASSPAAGAAAWTAPGVAGWAQTPSRWDRPDPSAPMPGRAERSGWRWSELCRGPPGASAAAVLGQASGTECEFGKSPLFLGLLGICLESCSTSPRPPLNPGFVSW